MDMLAAIRAQREEIAKKFTALQAEDAELAVAERVVARLSSAPESNTPPARAGQPRQTDLIVSTLKAMRSSWADDWSQLQQAIMGAHGVQIPKSSLQPYLSNLKNDGVIVRDGPRIALKSRVGKGESPESDNSYDPEKAAAPDDEEQVGSVRLRERTRFIHSQ